ncbi:adhesion G protein-coupled receptor E3-like [Oppia nitens]|uniref:adhesion G protein-coupled receptor E3-like n=1 Tax=Oppia nitens TaxID=1686743 RepID=UPI0023DAE012|nr:adhesion G protein-coupled receptor E3-like [Oppia nitens]
MAENAKYANFQCIDNTVFYYEDNEKEEWDRSRQLCAQKFGATPDADLVELSQDFNRDKAAEVMMSSLNLKSNAELATSGVCCMRKISDTMVGQKCQWLSSGREIKYNKPVDDKSCLVIVTTFNKDNKKFDDVFGVIKKGDDFKMNYLCAYNLPKGCPPRTIPTTTAPPPPISTTTTDSTETTHTTVSISTSSETPKSTVSTPSTTTIGPDTDVQKALDHLEKQLQKPDITTTDIIKCSDNLNKLLKNNSLETKQTLNQTLNIVDKMQQMFYLKSKNISEYKSFTENLVDSCSKVLDCDKAWSGVDQIEMKANLSANILKYMQESSFRLGCRGETTNNDYPIQEISKDNIVIHTFHMNYNNKTTFRVEKMQSSITIPEGIPEPEQERDCIRNTAVGTMFHKLAQYLKEGSNDKRNVNTNIVAFSIRNTHNSTRLPHNVSPVKISVKHHKQLVFGDKMSCVYWNFQQMKWSSEGCWLKTSESNRQITVCECNHLTNFAALMDVSGRETNTKVKDILTKVCCGLSIVCLIITIAFLTLIRTLRNRRNNITSNLCVCLLIVNLLVVFGMDLTEYNVLCETVSTLLLYSILASFSWMLMEGYHLYQMIVLVFSNIGHLRLIYLYAIGYGSPLVITLCTILAIGFNEVKQNDSYFCWISSPTHPYRVWAVAGPALVVILANTVIMYFALREAFSAKMKKKQIQEKDITVSSANNSQIINISEKLSQSFSWMKGFVSLVIMLGITWISFLLYIHEFGQHFSYIFIVLNGLQGVFIFTFQILLNEKARNVVSKSYRKRQPSRYLSSLYKSTSTNVFTSMRSKSLSREKSSNSSNNSSSDTNWAKQTTKKRLSQSNSTSSIASHKSQTIAMSRVRNASNSILY